jgi:DNA repair protein RadD
MSDRDVRVRDLVKKDQLRETLRKKQTASALTDTSAMPVQPQARRVQARKRLAQRTGSVVARVLKELGLSPNRREVGKINKKVGGQSNRAAVTKLLNTAINTHLGIASGSRRNPGADDNEDALAALDMLGDQVRDSLKGEPAEDA